MKNYSLILLSLVFVGCASTQELKQAQSCNVWKDNSVLGPNSYQVNGNSVTVKGQCLFWFWGCSERKTDIDAQGDVYHQGEGLFSSRTKIASMQGSAVVYEKSIFDAIGSADPIKIDMTQKTVHRKVSVKLFNVSSEDSLEFNDACKLPDVAVGAVAYWINENKKN